MTLVVVSWNLCKREMRMMEISWHCLAKSFTELRVLVSRPSSASAQILALQ